MKVLRILGVLAVALCALGGVASSASAAMVLPNFSVQTGGEAAGNAGTLFGAAEIKCKDLTATITMNADKKSGTFDIHFLGCEAFGAECHSEGDLKEIILNKGNWQLVLAVVAGADKHFVLFEPTETKITCAFLSTKVVVKGTVLGEIVSTGANTFNLKTVATSKTGQEFKEYENDEGAAVKTQLLSNTNGGAFSESGENAGTDVLTSTLNTAIEN